MLPTVFTIPLPWGGGIPVKGYGLMLMLGFLTAIWMTMRRAEKVRCDPDIVLNAGFLALICGVFGARLFYVVHYWESQFKDRGLWGIIDVTSGGLEFYGGLIAAVMAIVFYLMVKRYSVRLFLDIMAPSVMWGLAFGRMGCFLNGCCFGGTCPAHTPWPLAVTFPYGSPAHMHHFLTNRASLPREFMFINPGSEVPVHPISREHIAMKPEEIFGPRKKYKQAREAFEAAVGKLPPDVAARIREKWPTYERERQPWYLTQKTRVSASQYEQYRQAYSQALRGISEACSSAPNGQQIIKLIQAENTAWVELTDHTMNLRDLLGDRLNPRPETADLSAFQKKAQEFRSHPVYIAQVLGTINALIICGVLVLFFHRRRVHGAVFGLMLILKPTTRIILEFIRADNPIDAGGLTISQAVSLGMLPMGLLFLFIVYRLLPPQSPRATIWLPPRHDPPPPGEESASRAMKDGARRQAASPVETAELKRDKPKARGVDTVVVAPEPIDTADYDWHAKDAICAKCGAQLRPPDGLLYQVRASKRGGGQDKAPGVVEVAGADPNTAFELICESCFDRRPPQDKIRAKRLAKKWWKSGQV